MYVQNQLNPKDRLSADINNLFSLMKVIKEDNLKSIETDVVIPSVNILKGLQEHCTFRTLLQRDNPVFWNEINSKMGTDCDFNTCYQNIYKNHKDAYAKICGACRKGDCFCEAVLHDNPFKLGLVRVTVKLRKDVHSYKVHKRLAGTKRKIISRRALQIGTKMAHLEQFNTSDESDEGHSLETIQKAKQEIGPQTMNEREYLNELQCCLDYDDGAYIRALDLYPFVLSLYDDQMLEYVVNLNAKATWEDPLILSCDVSGEICYYPNNILNKKLNTSGLLTFSIAGPHAVPVCDIMLKKARSIDLIPSMIKWKDLLKRFSKSDDICQIWVLDFSWPLINTILRSVFETNINSYIQKKYCEMKSEYQLVKGESIILIDMLHLVKVFQKGALKKTNKRIANRFVLIFLKVLKCRSLKKVIELWQLTIKYFGYKYSCKATTLQLDQVCDEIEKSVSSKQDYIYQDELSDTDINGIRNKSKFKSLFQNITEEVYNQEKIELHNSCAEENEYFCKNIIQYFIDQYLPLLPLFSLAVVPSCYSEEYPTSSSVENHFKNLKHSCFKTIPLKSRTPALFLRKLQNWNSLQRKSVLQEERKRKKKKESLGDKWMSPSVKKRRLNKYIGRKVLLSKLT